MCTFDLSFNNDLVDSIRPAFKDDNDIKEWMQYQLEVLMSKLSVAQAKTQGTPYQHSLSYLRGIGSVDQSIDEMRNEHFQEKYGL